MFSSLDNDQSVYTFGVLKGLLANQNTTNIWNTFHDYLSSDVINRSLLDNLLPFLF